MTPSESDLIIKLRMLVEGTSDVDGLKRGLTDLIGKQQDATAAGVKASISNQGLTTSFNTTTRALGIFRNVLSGTPGSMMEAARAAQSLFASVSSLGVVMGGIGVGIAIFGALASLSKLFADNTHEADKTTKAADELKKKLEELDKAKLDALAESLERVSAAMKDSRDAAASLFEHQEKLMALAMKKEIVDATAGKTPEEAERIKFDIQSRYGEKSRKQRREFLEDQAATADRNIIAGQEAVGESDQELLGPEADMEAFKKRMAALGVLAPDEQDKLQSPKDRQTLDFTARLRERESKLLAERVRLRLSRNLRRMGPNKGGDLSGVASRIAEIDAEVSALREAAPGATEEAAAVGTTLDNYRAVAEAKRKAKADDIKRETAAREEARRKLKLLDAEEAATKAEEAARNRKDSGLLPDGTMAPERAAAAQEAIDKDAREAGSAVKKEDEALQKNAQDQSTKAAKEAAQTELDAAKAEAKRLKNELDAFELVAKTLGAGKTPTPAEVAAAAAQLPEVPDADRGRPDRDPRDMLERLAKWKNAAPREQAEADAASREYETFSETGEYNGRRISRKGSAGRAIGERLRDEMARQQQEADDALGEVQRGSARLVATVQRLAKDAEATSKRIEQIAAQIKTRPAPGE